MGTTLHAKEITTAQVSAVSFGFFSDEEVRHAWRWHGGQQQRAQ